MIIIHYILVLLTSLVLVLPGCSAKLPVMSPDATMTTGVPAFAPSSPIKVDLSISKLPVLNEPVEITCNVTSRTNAPNSTAKIKLSKGSSLISGDLQWQGDLTANTPVSFSAQIVFQEIGHHMIEATASHIIDDNNRYGDLDAIYLDIGTESSTFGWPVTPAPLVRTDKYSVIKTDLEISHAPKLNEPAKLFITIVSPVEFSNLDLDIFIFPKSAILTDSDLSVVPQVPEAQQLAMQVTGIDLQANVPFHFSTIVVFKEIGYYNVAVGTFQKVGGISYTGQQDRLYLKIGTQESTFEQAPPKETTPGNHSIPPAIRP
jgi:hypothetical protein